MRTKISGGEGENWEGGGGLNVRSLAFFVVGISGGRG